jgi:hypothetical protein
MVSRSIASESARRTRGSSKGARFDVEPQEERLQERVDPQLSPGVAPVGRDLRQGQA